MEVHIHQAKVKNMAIGVILDYAIRATYITEVEEITMEEN